MAVMHDLRSLEPSGRACLICEVSIEHLAPLGAGVPVSRRRVAE